MMAYVNVDVHVDIDAFDDDDILGAAVEIVRKHVKDQPRRSALLDAPVEALRNLLFAAADDAGEPLSAAAKLHDMSDLRNLVEKSGGFYRFAGDDA